MSTDTHSLTDPPTHRAELSGQMGLGVCEGSLGEMSPGGRLADLT